jgi:hypothetical protein
LLREIFSQLSDSKSQFDFAPERRVEDARGSFQLIRKIFLRSSLLSRLVVLSVEKNFLSGTIAQASQKDEGVEESKKPERRSSNIPLRRCVQLSDDEATVPLG